LSEPRQPAPIPDLATSESPGAISAVNGGGPSPDRHPNAPVSAAPEVRETPPAQSAAGIHIGAGNRAEHLTVVGPSQSGKTYLCKELLRPITSRIIIDPKQQDFGPEWGIVTSDPKAILYHPQVVWQPDLRDVLHPHPTGQDPFSEGLRYIYEVRADRSAAVTGVPAAWSVVVYFDEAYLTAPTEGGNPMIPVLLASGMGCGIAVWASTQRGYKVHANFFSDAVHTVTFFNQNQMDLAKLRNETGVDPKAVKALQHGKGHHEFLYHRQGLGWSGPYEL
jgi:hypothetical protein